jgi:hypothetical protein
MNYAHVYERTCTRMLCRNLRTNENFVSHEYMVHVHVYAYNTEMQCVMRHTSEVSAQGKQFCCSQRRRFKENFHK